MIDHTSIEVIVVGCGFAGLACAIESRRKGHKVVLLEKHLVLDILGDVNDVISFAANTGRLFERWGLSERLLPICTQHPTLTVHNHLGEILNVQQLPQKVFGSNSFNGRRGEIHDVLLEHARELGVEVKFGYEVVKFWEDSVTGKAGVVARVRGGNRNGEEVTFEGDVVVGADGVRSYARATVLGYEEKPKPSGYAIYRAWFKARECGVDTDPLTKHFYEDGNTFHAWVGKDLHMLAMSFNGGEDICCLLTHRDEDDIPESYSHKADVAAPLSYLEGWDPRCRAIFSKAPSCVDWKLVYRDPLPTWVSEEGRIVLIGDAAHPFLPTSVQGASQGVEDGVTLAVTLALAGKGDVPLATRVFEHIRYDRVRRAQVVGETTRDKWHSSENEKPVRRSDGDTGDNDKEANERKIDLDSDELSIGGESTVPDTRSTLPAHSQSVDKPSPASTSNNSIESPSISRSTSSSSMTDVSSASASSDNETLVGPLSNSDASGGEVESDKLGDATSDDNKVELPLPTWLLNFDAEAHAYAVYDEVAKRVTEKGYERPKIVDGL